jgi:hypothetical protein
MFGDRHKRFRKVQWYLRIFVLAQQSKAPHMMRAGSRCANRPDKRLPPSQDVLSVRYDRRGEQFVVDVRSHSALYPITQTLFTGGDTPLHVLRPAVLGRQSFGWPGAS